MGLDRILLPFTSLLAKSNVTGIVIPYGKKLSLTLAHDYKTDRYRRFQYKFQIHYFGLWPLTFCERNETSFGYSHLKRVKYCQGHAVS